MKDKVLGILGIAMRAGGLVSGEFSTEKLIKSGKAKLVIVAGDASYNTKKLFYDKCKFYQVDVYEYSNKADLGAVIGKGERSSIGINDEELAKAIGNKLSIQNKLEVEY